MFVTEDPLPPISRAVSTSVFDHRDGSCGGGVMYVLSRDRAQSDEVVRRVHDSPPLSWSS